MPTNYTQIEVRDPFDGKLKDFIFDENIDWYIQKKIDALKEMGYIEISIIKNPHNFQLFYDLY